jgi:hypothetical protein
LIATSARSMAARRRYIGGLAAGPALVLALSAGCAHAQLIIDQPRITEPPWNAQRPFDPTPLPILTDPDSRDPVTPEDTPVKNRAHPEYQARGIRFGPWMYYPTATIGSFYDSNVFSSATNRQDDFAARFAAGLRARSLWERHALDLELSTQSLLYRNHSGLNQTDVDFKGTGRLDIDHSTQLLGRVQAAYLHDEVGSLTSPTGAVEPTPYGFGSADVTLRKEFGRFTASIGTRVDTYDYGSTRAQNGTTINQDARDGQIYSIHERIDYAFSKKMAVFASLENNWRDLRGSPGASLNSNGYRALAGVNLELTRLIKGEFAAGYLRQNFDSPLIGDVSGPAYRVMLTWSPSRRLDIHFNAEQMVTTTADTSPTGVLANSFQLGADYEIRPNLVLSPLFIYEKDDFKGQPRNDDVYAAELRLKRMFNNVASASLYYRYLRRDSNIPANNYDKHLFGINASVQF